MSKLSVSVASSLSQYTTLDPISDGHYTQSASLAAADREIKALKEENFQLKKEIAEIGSAYKQLVTENSHETYDERRVNFLKAQMIQLERQVLILSEALSSRASALLEVENSLAAIADLCKHYMKKGEKIGEVSVTKDDLYRLIQTAESARHRLYKTMENTNADRVQKPVMMFDKFLRPSQHGAVTLLDICSGNIQHLNLKHVAKLESRLSQLYRQLMLISQSLHSIVSADEQSTNNKRAMFETANHASNIPRSSSKDTGLGRSANKDLPKCVFARLGSQVGRTSEMLKDVTQELLYLTVLVPSAPWPALKKPLLKELTTANVMSKVTGLPRSKVTEVKSVVDSLLKAMNYQCLMANAEAKAVKEEISFHQNVYNLQLEYTESLWQAMRVSFLDFQTNTDQMICQPMKELLDGYETLQITASEDALKHFLKLFKLHHLQLSESIQKMSVHLTDTQGQEAISAYGEDFFNSLNKLRAEQQTKRDDLLNNLDFARQQHHDYTEEIQRMFPEKSESESSPSKEDPDITTLTLNLESTKIDNNIVKTGIEKETPRTRRRNKKDKTSLSPEKSIEKENYSCELGKEPECTCGAEHHEHLGTTNLTHVESGEHLDGYQSSKDRQNDPFQKPPNRNQPMPATWRPPKPVKGVAQAKLALKPKTNRKNPGNSQTESVDYHQPLRKEHRTESLSDVSQSPILTDEDNSGYIPSMRVRSGSLSRLGQGSPKPGHLEPLLSAKAQASLPWR